MAEIEGVSINPSPSSGLILICDENETSCRCSSGIIYMMDTWYVFSVRKPPVIAHFPLRIFPPDNQSSHFTSIFFMI